MTQIYIPEEKVTEINNLREFKKELPRQVLIYMYFLVCMIVLNEHPI